MICPFPQRIQARFEGKLKKKAHITPMMFRSLIQPLAQLFLCGYGLPPFNGAAQYPGFIPILELIDDQTALHQLRNIWNGG